MPDSTAGDGTEHHASDNPSPTESTAVEGLSSARVPLEQPGEQPRRRHPIARFKHRLHFLTLRTRLLLTLGALLSVGILVCSLAGVTALKSYLMGQVDVQLIESRNSIVGEYLSTPGPLTINQAAFSEYSFEVRDADGSLIKWYPSTLGTNARHQPQLSDEQVLNEANTGEAFTVEAQDDERYEFRAVAIPFEESDRILVLAVPTDAVNSTISRLMLINACAIVIVLTILSAAAYIIIRRDLQPLESMTRTAGAIGAGDLTQRVSRADDHTEVGQLGTALNAMMSQIEASFAERQASEDRLRRFAADASHELRTPLTAIRGYAELHRQGAVTDEEHLQRIMERIENEARRMGLMVEDLLLLARLDQGRAVELSPVGVADIARNVVSDAHAIAPDRTIELSVSGDERTLLVNGERGRLHQVLTNLVSNAIKYTPTDKPIDVTVRRIEDDVELAVQDQGPGMDAESVAKVFDRFYRVDKGRARAQGGTGLGLAIVDALVHAHGGTVRVDTELGQGARFVVTLPALPTPPMTDDDGEVNWPSSGLTDPEQ